MGFKDEALYTDAPQPYGEIFTMKADGTDVRLLANTEGRATAPQWGRDGLRVYFPVCWKAGFGSDCEIFAVRTQGFAR